MKNKLFAMVCCVLISCFFCFKTKAQVSPGAMPTTLINYPWTDGELIEPAQLVATLKEAPASQPLILNIGAVEDIKDAKHIGAVSNADNMNMLISTVAALPKNTAIVIYCGCCPFTKCPNIRPAFQKLKKLGFTNVKLLNLPTNLQTNWIAKGYPLAGS